MAKKRRENRRPVGLAFRLGTAFGVVYFARSPQRLQGSMVAFLVVGIGI